MLKFALGLCRAGEWPACSIPVVCLLTEKYRVVQLLQNREVRAGGGPTLRLTLTLAPSCGFLVRHVEVLLAWRRSGRERKKETNEMDSGKKAASAQR